jgi:hypothetical protein
MVVFLMWAFTNRMSVAFDHFIYGFIGFLLLPATTMCFALANAPRRGVSTIGWVVVAIGFIYDLSSSTNAGRRSRNRAGAS